MGTILYICIGIFVGICFTLVIKRKKKQQKPSITNKFSFSDFKQGDVISLEYYDGDTLTVEEVGVEFVKVKNPKYKEIGHLHGPRWFKEEFRFNLLVPINRVYKNHTLELRKFEESKQFIPIEE